METLSLLVSIAAFAVALFSWFAAIHANRAALFDRRFEVYRDAEEFIRGWQRHGRPDIELLPKLVDAWNRSHFLFDADVTAYLRKLWLDAVDADECAKVASREVPADVEERQKHRKKASELFKKYTENEQLRNAFLPHLKVSDGYLEFPRWIPDWLRKNPTKSTPSPKSVG
ncbi:MAG: hypothetical protein WBP94_18500 [Rhodomicrobiaceae bacterium]